MPRISTLISRMTRSQRSIAATAVITLLVVAVVKFVLVRSLLSLGVPRELLQAQDAIITGGLAAGAIWVVLVAVRVRRTQRCEERRKAARTATQQQVTIRFPRNGLRITYSRNHRTVRLRLQSATHDVRGNSPGARLFSDTCSAKYPI